MNQEKTQNPSVASELAYKKLEYEDYSKTARKYSTARLPAGFQTIIDLIPNAKSAHVLDAGCGTGNYLCVLAPLVKTIVGLEVSDAMIEQAKAKVLGMDNVEIMKGNLLAALPFPDNTFDAITINQVCHHLVEAGNFENQQKLYKEFSRVLKKDGKLIVNACTSEQALAPWFFAIARHLFEPLAKNRYCDEPIHREMMKNAGMSMQVSNLSELIYETKLYYNISGVFDPMWRQIDSLFTSLTATENGVAEYEKICYDKMANGTILGELVELEENRKKLYCTSFFIGNKM